MTSDRIVLITGGSRGIGRAVARRLAVQGAEHIVIAYTRDHDAARDAVDELKAMGTDASALLTDVGQPELLDRLFGEVRDRFGRLDVFISNAARASFRPVREIKYRGWRKMMDLNAFALLRGAQLAAELMTERGGVIVALSSLGATRAIPKYAGLGVAKAAVESLTRYLAAELAPAGIRVNAVSAGFVDTDSMRMSPDYAALTEHVVSNTPMNRLANVEDVAGVVAFLCSDDARWICGQTIIADGGASLLL